MTTRQRIITPVGRTAWCHVLNPRENLAGKLQWDVALEIDEEYIKQYSAIARQLIEDARSGDPNFPRTDNGFTYPWMQSRGPKSDGGVGDIIPGKYLIKGKRNFIRTRGGSQEKNTAPILQDGLGQPIKPGTLESIPPSTEARLMLDLFAWHGPGPGAGVSAGLVGMQIKKLGASDTFDPLEGFDAVENGDDEPAF